MSAAWIVYMLLVGTLLALGAAAISSALALAGRSTRWVWAAALVGVALLSALAPRVTERRMDGPVSIDAPRVVLTGPAPASRGFVAVVVAAREVVASMMTRGIASLGERIPRGLARPAAISWTAASALLLALYLFINARFAVARRRWPAARLHDVPVRVAPFAGPAVIGLVRAEIVVPRSLLARSAEEQRLIITHEHEHLRAGDHLLLGVACLFVIALPWHPAVWYILARLRLAIELDCDARVLRRGAAPRSYGALLIDMAARGSGIRVGTLALADRPSHLERRLLAMKTIRSRYALVRGGALTAVACLLVLAACEAKIPTVEQLNSMDVATLEKTLAEGASGAKSSAGGPGPNADYFVDGVQKTRDEANALHSTAIMSVEVVKGARDTIMITTTSARLDTAIKVVRARTTGPAAEPAASLAPRELPRRSADVAHQPELTIDGVSVAWSRFESLRPEDIASIEVFKATDARVAASHPDGLVAVTMHTAATRAGSMKERKP